MLETMINALALTNEKYYYYLDTDTMTVVKNRSTIGDMDVSYMAHACPERFLPLPNKRQLHTYAIMVLDDSSFETALDQLCATVRD